MPKSLTWLALAREALGIWLISCWPKIMLVSRR
jgi:hypothetical protein